MMDPVAVLNNPVWEAMNSGNAELARAGTLAKSFQERISPFVGLKDFSRKAFQELQTIPSEETMAVVTKAYGTPTDSFHIIAREIILQMVCWEPTIERVENDSLPLNELHVPLMLALTQLTKPGPFLDHTIRFGNYFGLFESGRLAAMAGRRLHAGNFIEISAVCTHPDFSGKGYARKLISDEVLRIRTQNCTPYLHVRPNNENAIRLYQKLGFQIHQEMNLLILKRATTRK